jgi:hypothetical protein
MIRSVACALASLCFLLSAGCGPAANGPGNGSDLGAGSDLGGVTSDGAIVDGASLDGPSCPTNCTLGATSCDGSGVRTCVMVGSCTDWSQPQACAQGQVCSGGQCAGQCSNQCTIGSAYCSQGGVRACVNAGGCTDWSQMITACPSGTFCSGGACAASCTDRCSAGASQCAGSSVQSCVRQSSGCLDWSDPVPCSGGSVCSGGACAASCTDQCTSGQSRCMGADSLQTCAQQTSGCTDWSPAQICGSGVCSGNACAPCTDGTHRCGSSGNVEQCVSGTWTQVAGCAFGCMSGACTSTVTCTPGAYRCNGSGVEICNSSGTAWLLSATCAISCSGGLCTGACTPAAKRCNGKNVEECSADGTTWAVSAMCSTSCDPESSACALASLDVTSSMNLDGDVAVSGPVVVHSGATLTSPAGDLTLRASSITVELGGSIVVSPTGATAAGRGHDGTYSSYYGVYGGGGGGGYGAAGTMGGSSYAGGSSAGVAFGSNVDATISAGAMGGNGGSDSGGHGGGVVRLIAPVINLAGQVTASGENGHSGSSGGGGGSGGGILLAGDAITVSGSLTASGGSGGTGSASYGGAGGFGRVKLLRGATFNVTGTVTGTRTDGILPPITITSSTHPDEALIYNDDFPVIALSWNQPFPSRQGYYQRIDQVAVDVPTPANGQFVASELLSLMPSAVSAGANYFHIASVDAMSNPGTVEGTFKIQINSTPPQVTSSSHPSQTAWSTNQTAFFAWTFPVADANVKGVYYVLDHYGSTVPTFTDTFLPVGQKQLILNLTDGVWAFHVVALDQRGYLTKKSGSYQVRIGADPGSGTVLGHVVDNTSASVANATVTVNRGLFGNQTSNASGNYNFPSVVAGTWEVTASAPGLKSSTQMVTVTSTGSSTANFTLSP